MGGNRVEYNDWNLVEICIEFSNHFELDSTGEIILKSKGDIWLKNMQILQTILVGLNQQSQV